MACQRAINFPLTGMLPCRQQLMLMLALHTHPGFHRHHIHCCHHLWSSIAPSKRHCHHHSHHRHHSRCCHHSCRHHHSCRRISSPWWDTLLLVVSITLPVNP